MESKEKAKNIVDKIIRDLSDRRGLRQEWEQIDLDIQEEIKETWIGIVTQFLVQNPGCPYKKRAGSGGIGKQ